MTKKTKDIDNYFPIRELSARTQVNTVTLRAWERRYGLLTPKRSSKGHRLYSEKDVKVIEKVLKWVARGVSIGKVKPLLQGDTFQPSEQDDKGNWQTLTSQFLNAVESFSVTKVEYLIHQLFANYPVQVCRTQLIEPVFAEITQSDPKGIALGFLESEMIRYTLMRLSAKVRKKKSARAVKLIAGDQASMWRLVLMALELFDMGFSVYLFSRAFSVPAGIELAAKFKNTDVVLYQDGLLKGKEKAFLAAALLDNGHLFLCGTAPMLTQLDYNDRIFADLKSCIDSLQKL